MAPPTLGFGTTVAIGAEVTYGTSVARTHTLKVRSQRASFDVGVEEAADLGDADLTSANIVRMVETLEEAGGAFSTQFEANNNSILMLLYYMFGAVADGGTGPSSYTHTYTLDNRSASRPFASLEHVHGDGDAKLMEGCVVSRWSIVIEPGRPVMINVEYIAETGNALASQTALTPYASEILIGNFSGVMAWNAVNHVPRRVVISVDHGYTRRYVVGSAQTLQPVIGARTQVTVEAELEHGVLTDPEAAYEAGTTSDLTITLTAAGGETHAFTMQNARIVRGIERNVSGFGIIPKTVLFRGQADAGGGGDEGLTLVVGSSSIQNYNDT